jgi:hypothetical protein
MDYPKISAIVPVLTGNDLGQLANVTAIPAIDPSYDDPHLARSSSITISTLKNWTKSCMLMQKKLLEQGLTKEAWQVLLAGV